MNKKIALISCLVGGLMQAMEIDDSQGTIGKWDDLVEQTEDSDTSVIGEPFTKRSRIEKDDLISPDWDGIPAEIKQIILRKLLSVQDPFKTYKQLHELRRLSRDMNDQCLDLLKTEFLAEQAQAMIETDKDKAGDLFVKAVEFDNDLMQLLIDKGVDVCFFNQKMKRRALEFASALGRAGMVETLLSNGAHFNTESCGDALARAIQSGHTAVAEKLLLAGALDAPVQAKLLISAICLKKIDTLKALLEKGIDPNCADSHDRSCLRYAIIGGDKAIAQLLLDYKAIDHSGLIVATALGKKDIVKLFLDYGANVNRAHDVGGTPLIAAVRSGYTAIVKMLIEAKANVNLANSNQETALFWASSKGFTGIVILLLAHGAQVNTLTSEGATALMVASSRGHVNVAQALLDAHAHIHRKDANDRTALVWACQYGHIQVVQLLLAHGADVNVVIKNNNLTPLLLAVQGGYTELVELLLKHDADIHAKTADGNTALMIAAKKEDFVMLRLIMEKLKN